MKKRMLFLVVSIPLASVLMGAVLLFLANSYDDALEPHDAQPLTKTSWEERP